MKEKQAIQILRDILLGAQRVRSIVQETFGELPDLPQELIGQALQALYDADEAGEYLHLSNETLAEMHPYIFGEVSLVGVVADLLDRVESGQGLAPLDFYNAVLMANREPLMRAWFAKTGWHLPEPDVVWMAGWEGES